MTIPSSATGYHVLLSRGANDDGTTNSNLSNGAIIVIVLVAAGFLVLIGFSVTRFYFSKDEELEQHTYRDEQVQYMHSLRRRNREDLSHNLGIKASRQLYHSDNLRAFDDGLDQSSRASTAFSP